MAHSGGRLLATFCAASYVRSRSVHRRRTTVLRAASCRRQMVLLGVDAGQSMPFRTRALRTDASAMTSAATPKPIWPVATIRAPDDCGARLPGCVVVNVATDRYAAPARSSGSVNALMFCCATDQ